MKAAKSAKISCTLKRELLLQVNQRLYEAGKITQSMYENAKIKIVNGT